jgi:Domain of unknown function (DUF4142)
MTSRIAFLECGGNPEVAFWGRRLWLWTALILPAAIKPRLWSVRPPMCCSGADRKPLTCRAFARLMVLDQMELESQLAAVATENGVQLPNGPSEQAKQEMATLQEMSGAKFDAAYMQHMVQGHEQAVQRFKSEKGQAQSRPVQAVVAATLPIIEQHLALAQAVQSGIQNQGAGTIGSANSRK